MAKPKQVDIEDGTLSAADHAATALRAFQRGEASLKTVQDAIGACQSGDLVAVSVATRIPIKRILELKG